MGDQSQVTQSDRGSCCLVGSRSQEGLSCPPCAPSSLPASLAGTHLLGPFYIPDVACQSETDAANSRAKCSCPTSPPLTCSRQQRSSWGLGPLVNLGSEWLPSLLHWPWEPVERASVTSGLCHLLAACYQGATDSHSDLGARAQGQEAAGRKDLGATVCFNL